MDTFLLGDIEIAVTRKNVKNVHLAVHPPEGRVTLVAPMRSRLDVLRAYAITRLGWIRKQQAGFRAQAREAPRRPFSRESHSVWGRRYLLGGQIGDAKPGVRLDHKRITLSVPDLIRAWERRLGVKVQAYYLQRMKTRWGSCNHTRGHIRLNTELVKKPRHLLEYVVVHEIVHLIAPTHDERFIALLDEHFPRWREARAELNSLPLATQ